MKFKKFKKILLSDCHVCINFKGDSGPTGIFSCDDLKDTKILDRCKVKSVIQCSQCDALGIELSRKPSPIDIEQLSKLMI